MESKISPGAPSADQVLSGAKTMEWLGSHEGAVIDAGEIGFDADTYIFESLSDVGSREWVLDFELKNKQGNGPYILIGRQCWKFSLGSRNYPAASLSAFMLTIASTGVAPFPEGQWVKLRIARANGSISLDGSHGLSLSASDHSSELPVKDLEIFFPAGTHVKAFSLFSPVVNFSSISPPKISPLLRSVTIDFNDDVIPGSWDHGTLDQQMSIYRQSGIRRVYFLPTAHPDDGYWKMPAAFYPTHRKHVLETQDALGDFLPAFASAAKSHGLEFFAVYKPFDYAFEKDALPFGTSGAEGDGCFNSLSGEIVRATDWMKAHPSMRLQRRPDDMLAVREVGEIRRVILASEIVGGKSSFSLWASPNNFHYSQVNARIALRTERSIEWEVPAGTPPRLAIVREPGRAGRFGNRLSELVRCFDAVGRSVPVTFATASDVSRKKRTGAFPELSFAFDVNLVGAQMMDCRESYWWMEESTPLGIAAGYENFVVGAPCPAYAEVREHWLQEVKRCFDCGCDGVDIRVANHNRTFDWDRYGFNGPVLREIGPNPSSEDVRSCLGRHYSRFIEESSRLARERGGKLHIHLEHGFRTPNLPCDMNIAFDWNAWLETGWADEITLMAHSATAGIMPLMAGKAKSLGIPVNIRPYFNSVVRGKHTKQLIDNVLSDAVNCAVDGLNIYENASFFKVNKDRRLEATAAPWWNMLTRA